MKSVPSLRALAVLRDQLISKPFTCKSCLTKRNASISSKHRQVPSPWLPKLARGHRQASQIVPVTTIDAKKRIPTELRELYDQLHSLQQSGSGFVSISQLQLALKGLESSNSVTRIAVLGIAGSNGPRKLVQALLADPLAARAEWEDILDNSHDNRALLIRYRDAVQYDRRHPLLRTLAIPSTLLDRHKLELLIHEATIPTDPTVPFRESITNVLVPTLATPSSASGRASIITYPVHKSILYGEGLDALGAISNIIYGITEKHHNMIFGVASVTWRIADRSPSNVSLVNVEEGQEAIRSLRESSSNSSKYEHCWLASNLSLVSSFISEGDAGDAPVKPALANLISTVASHAEEAISLEKSRYREALDTATVSSETRQSLESAISYWAELAHTELRDELERVFHAPSWRKLTWWKLPWTVDDIPIIASEALHRAYLIEAEMGIIWVSGRLQEAGLIPPFEPKLSAEKAQPFFEARDLEVGDIVPDLAPGSHHNLKAMRPWPLQIAASRTTLLQTLPPLQATAQRLLLEGLSTTSLGLTISFLVYLSVSTTSIYETGAVASLALAWSARRVQVQWERAKRQWIDSVVSEGKQTLDAVERSCRSIVQQGGRPEEDVAAAEQRVRAREAVEGIRRSLSKVVKG